MEAHVSDARPLRSLREAPAVVHCAHDEPTLELIPLPTVDEAGADDAVDERAMPPAVTQRDGPSLLPPRDLATLGFTELTTDAPAVEASPSPVVASIESLGHDANPHIAEAEQLLADASPTATGSPTGAIVSERAQAKIRRGYALAHRGANFAARSEFLQVLRMIAEAKDQKHGASRRTIALANGLRALEEAADFVPRGQALDAEVSVAVIVSSHRTLVAKIPDAERLMPQQLADLYFRYAQLQLGGAVAGEPAGSMALHALGKVYSQLERTEPELNPQADRSAFALQQAALLARDDNHLAAHELGVLLAESGHYIESEHLLNQVAATQPHPVVFRNLARVQRKLGREQLAVASEQRGQVLAARGGNSGGSVMWVPPAALAQAGDAAPTAHVAAKPPIPRPRMAAAPAVAPTMQNVTRLPGGYMR